MLRIDPEADGFTGEVTIGLELGEAAPSVNLHAMELELQSIQLICQGETRTLTATPAEGPGREAEKGELLLSDGETIPAGAHELKIRYQGLYNQTMCGLYKVSERGKAILVTQFEAADARRCLPCFDEPSFKAPFTLELQVPHETACFSNAPERSREPLPLEGDQAQTFDRVCFETTPPLPTYLMALCAGDFVALEAASVGDTPVRVIVPRGKESLAEVAREFTPPLLATLEGIFGIPYPYAKLDVVAVPEFAAGAMENAGLVTFREVYLLADPATLTRSRARSIAEVVAHELAHHWFGNLVTMDWWDDLWLNEAFATWMAARVVDTWRPEFEQVLALLEVRSRILEQDALPSARQIQQPVASVADAEQAFDGITYYKGAAVLETIERWIGEEAFRKGVRDYLEAHRWGNARSEDLFRQLERASGKPVSEVCKGYITQAGVPLLSFEELDGKSFVDQKPFTLLGLEAPNPTARWTLPLPMPGGGYFLLGKDTRTELPYSVAGHSPNPEESSYLRWALSPEALAELLEKGDALTLRERVGLLDATWAAFSAGAGELRQWAQAIESLASSAERPLLERVAASCSKLLSLYPELDPERGEAALRGILSERASVLLEGNLTRLGLSPKEGEPEGDTIVRPAVLAAAARFAGAAKVVAFAEDHAEAILKGETQLSTEIATVLLSHAARSAQAGVSVETLAPQLFEAKDPERRGVLLSALARVPEGAAAEAARALLLDPRFRAQDFRSIFFMQMQRHETRTKAFAWFMENFEAVRARQPEFTFIQIGLVLREFRQPDALSEARDALLAKKVHGGERSIEQGAQAATHAIALSNFGRGELPSLRPKV